MDSDNFHRSRSFLFSKEKDRSPLSREDKELLSSKITQVCEQVMAKIPEVSGIMIVGSGATLFSENTTMHHGSDFDIIPITTFDFSDDPLERSIIADKVRDAFAIELQNSGIQIKLDIFYPAISSAKSELVSQAMSISRELSNTPFHIVQKGK